MMTMMIMMMLMMMMWKDDADGALDPWSCLQTVGLNYDLYLKVCHNHIFIKNVNFSHTLKR